jgi:hypothetical protein
MTIYTGQPVFTDATELPDDGSPPDASQVNAPLEGLLDNDVWLARQIQRASIGLGAQNLQPTFINAAVATLFGDDTSAANPRTLALGANDREFVAVFSYTGGIYGYPCVSRDGVSWSQIDLGPNVVISGSSGRIPTAVASTRQTDGRVVVIGGSSNELNPVASNFGGGKWIWTLTGEDWQQPNTTTLAANTNYVAGCFANGRAFLFGGTGTAAQPNGDVPAGPITGLEARIVSADGDMQTWGNVTGGSWANTNGLYTAEAWDVAALGNIVLAFARRVDLVAGPPPTYVRITASTNIATEEAALGPVTSFGLTTWRGEFWHLRRPFGFGPAELHSSPDGLTWTLRATLPTRTVAPYRLLRSADSLVVLCVERFDDLGADANAAISGFMTFDGAEFFAAPISAKLSARSIVAATEARAALLSQPGRLYLDDLAQLRISLGGVL